MISLFSKVRDYKELSNKLQSHLSRYPNDWSKFQDEFNLRVDKVAEDILQSEKTDARIDKLKKIFEKRYRRYFLYGELIKRSLEKPLGYAGDYKIIDEIYKDNLCSTAFERLWDNYFQRLTASKATRERKEDYKKIILDFIRKCRNRNIRIMNLATGSGREIKELLDSDVDKVFSNVIFDCYDFDERAINYAKELLKDTFIINFIQKNAIKLAMNKNINKEIPYEYNIIYSAGFFDYLSDRIAIGLLKNLNKIISKEGLMVISNYRDRGSNPSACLMEWVADWNLIYRTEEEFRALFLKAGFPKEAIQIVPQRSKVMQYCIVRT